MTTRNLYRSTYCEESARTLGVVDADGYNGANSCEKTHRHTDTNTHFIGRLCIYIYGGDIILGVTHRRLLQLLGLETREDVIMLSYHIVADSSSNSFFCLRPHTSVSPSGYKEAKQGKTTTHTVRKNCIRNGVTAELQYSARNYLDMEDSHPLVFLPW